MNTCALRGAEALEAGWGRKAPGQEPWPGAAMEGAAGAALLLLLALPRASPSIYLNSWAARVPGGAATAELLARKHGLLLLGQVRGPPRGSGDGARGLRGAGWWELSLHPPALKHFSAPRSTQGAAPLPGFSRPFPHMCLAVRLHRVGGKGGDVYPPTTSSPKSGFPGGKRPAERGRASGFPSWSGRERGAEANVRIAIYRVRPQVHLVWARCHPRGE